MSFSITDSFAGSSGTALTSHTTDQGNAWVRPAGGTSGSYNLSGDGTVNGIDSGEFAVVDTTISGSADYSVFCTINAGYCGPVIRCDKAAASPTFYKALWHSGVGNWYLQKIVAGVGTYIANGGASYTPIGGGNSRDVELRVTGTTIALYIGGTLVLTATDSSISAAGTGGISLSGVRSFSMSGAGTASGGSNIAPVITSNGGGSTASISVAENNTAVTTVTATDADVGDTLTYSISGGADAAKFTINSSTGALSFQTAPDFEVPTDADANNQYIVIVQVSDGTASDTQTITVTVTDVADAPAPQPAWGWMMG